MEPKITVEMTPPDLIKRMGRYPKKLDATLKKTMEASLLHVQGSVPSYPPETPAQTYRRTGTLGRSLGVAQSGSTLGQPDIKLVRPLGASGYRGEFGTNLSYAPPVIGEGTQTKAFKGRWWTMKTVADRATKGVVRLHDKAAELMARFLEGG